MTLPATQDHFEDLEKQAHAARLGMWVFLASEVLLFSALFTLFAAYRAQHPSEFHAAVHDNTKILGSINTGVLLVSSTLVACAVHALRRGRAGRAAALVGSTMTLGGVFLAIKITEYLRHFHEGIYPGARGHYFVEHGARGFAEFWTLYFAMTGIHAIHVTIGVCLLSVMLLGIATRRVTPRLSHRLEIAAIYWHLVDLVWIFLWPLLYLS